MSSRLSISPGRLVRSLSLALGSFLIALQPLSASVSIEVFFDDRQLSDGTIAILVADVNQDGFLSPDDPTIPGTAIASGENIGTSDDIIVAVLEADAGSHWNGGAGIADPAERISYADLGITSGTPLILYILPDANQPGDLLAEGDRITRYRNTEAGGSGGDIAFVAPDDTGIYTLSALVSESGGNFDPQNLTGNEVYDAATIGGEDHGGTRATATRLTSADLPTSGSLEPGNTDYFSFSVDGPSRVVFYTTGNTDTLGELFSPGGSPLNDPAADGNEGTDTNFRIEETILAAGIYYIAVTGEEGSQTGTYDLLYEIIPFIDRRPDAMIGKKFSRQRGNDYYNHTGGKQEVSQATSGRQSMTYYFTVQNDGELPDTISISARGKSGRFIERYYQMTGGTENVTAQISRSGYPFSIDSREEVHLKLKLTPTRRTARSRRSGKQIYRIKARSGILVDAVRAVAWKK